MGSRVSYCVFIISDSMVGHDAAAVLLMYSYVAQGGIYQLICENS